MSIKFKLGEDSGESPVLATFPGGAPDAKTLKKGGDDALHFQLLKNTNSKKAKQRVLQCESGDFEFTGKNFGSDSASSASESRYMMALFDPTKVKGSDGSSQSTKVKLMDIPHFFEMRQNLEGLEAGSGKKHKLGDLDRNTQKRLLTEAFGSRKRQRIVRSNELNKVKLDDNSSQVLKIALSNVTKSEPDAPSNPGLDFARDALPKYDLETEQVEKIYDLKEMLSKSQWKVLGKTIAKFEELLASDVKMEKPEDPKDNLPGFIVHCVNARTLKSATGKGKKRTLKSLALLQCLLEFKKAGRDKRMVPHMFCIFYHLQLKSVLLFRVWANQIK